MDGYVEGPFGRCDRSFDGYVEDEALKGAQIPKPTGGNDDTAIVVATFCWTAVRSRPRRPPIQETDPPFARWWDHDPSRIALSHGNGDFGQRAWRDHVELPDSAAELPFGSCSGLLARRFRSSRSGHDRTPYRQEPESGSDHTETICTTLHQHSETHYPPAQPQFLAASSPEPIERAAVLGPIKAKALRVAAKTRPALTGPARGGCAIWRSGRKNARGAGRTKEWNLPTQYPNRSSIFAAPHRRRHVRYQFGPPFTRVGWCSG